MIFVLSFVYVVRVWLLCFHYFCLVCNDYQKNNVTKLHTMLVVWNHGDGFTNWPSFTVCIILFSFFFFLEMIIKKWCVCVRGNHFPSRQPADSLVSCLRHLSFLVDILMRVGVGWEGKSTLVVVFAHKLVASIGRSWQIHVHALRYVSTAGNQGSGAEWIFFFFLFKPAS